MVARRHLREPAFVDRRFRSSSGQGAGLRLDPAGPRHPSIDRDLSRVARAPKLWVAGTRRPPSNSKSGEPAPVYPTSARSRRAAPRMTSPEATAQMPATQVRWDVGHRLPLVPVRITSSVDRWAAAAWALVSIVERAKLRRPAVRSEIWPLTVSFAEEKLANRQSFRARLPVTVVTLSDQLVGLSVRWRQQVAAQQAFAADAPTAVQISDMRK